ncbi:hypothetical protein SLA2020_485280 [Shorea laevis]
MASSSAALNPASGVTQPQLDEEINIYLKIMKTVTCKVKPSETVKDLKESLHEKGLVSENIQRLFFADQLLEDNERLVDYGIQRNSTVSLIVQDFVGMKLFVEIPSGQRTIVVEARPNDTVESIKSVIQVKEGIHSDQFMLVYDGILLEEDRTLASLNIDDKSTLHLVFCQKDVLSIFVKTYNHTVRLQVKVTFTIGDIKAIAARMLGVSAGNLMYAGKKLQDSEILACYDIKDESILEMVPPTFQIFVKTWSGKTILLDVYGSSTIGDVKEMIFQKLKIPVHLQSFTYAGKRLENGMALESYKIHKECTLHMVLVPSSTFIPVKLDSLDGFISDTTTIHDLKVMIKKKGYRVKEVLFRGSALHDEYTVAHYGINKKAEVVAVQPN